MNKFAYDFVCTLSNNMMTSTFINRVSRRRLSRFFIAPYRALFKIKDDGEQYASLHDFFTRCLPFSQQQNLSNLDMTTDDIISPVQGKIAFVGETKGQTQFLIKNQTYTLSELLGQEVDITNNYACVLFYLSPANYHRFHAPVTASFQYQKALGKYSYPVNDMGLKYTEKLYAKNYRHVYRMNEQSYFIAIGAMNINSITTHLTQVPTKQCIGEEIGFFSFGSSVLLLLDQSEYKLSSTLTEGMLINVGDIIGGRAHWQSVK